MGLRDEIKLISEGISNNTDEKRQMMAYEHIAGEKMLEGLTSNIENSGLNLANEEAPFLKQAINFIY